MRRCHPGQPGHRGGGRGRRAGWAPSGRERTEWNARWGMAKAEGGKGGGRREGGGRHGRAVGGSVGRGGGPPRLGDPPPPPTPLASQWAANRAAPYSSTSPGCGPPRSRSGALSPAARSPASPSPSDSAFLLQRRRSGSTASTAPATTPKTSSSVRPSRATSASKAAPPLSAERGRCSSLYLLRRVTSSSRCWRRRRRGGAASYLRPRRARPASRPSARLSAEPRCHVRDMSLERVHGMSHIGTRLSIPSCGRCASAGCTATLWPSSSRRGSADFGRTYAGPGPFRTPLEPFGGTFSAGEGGRAAQAAAARSGHLHAACLFGAVLPAAHRGAGSLWRLRTARRPA